MSHLNIRKIALSTSTIPKDFLPKAEASDFTHNVDYGKIKGEYTEKIHYQNTLIKLNCGIFFTVSNEKYLLCIEENSHNKEFVFMGIFDFSNSEHSTLRKLTKDPNAPNDKMKTLSYYYKLVLDCTIEDPPGTVTVVKRLVLF